MQGQPLPINLILPVTVVEANILFALNKSNMGVNMNELYKNAAGMADGRGNGSS